MPAAAFLPCGDGDPSAENERFAAPERRYAIATLGQIREGRAERAVWVLDRGGMGAKLQA